MEQEREIVRERERARERKQASKEREREKRESKESKGAFFPVFSDSGYTDRTRGGLLFVKQSPGSAALMVVLITNCNRTSPPMARPTVNFKYLKDIMVVDNYSVEDRSNRIRR
jgi:hypothetical protein